MIRYSCQSELLPTIEGALAAHGYQIQVPLKTRSNGAGIMVMIYGLTSVLLAQLPDNATLEIAIWGMAQPIVAKVLECLPIQLHRQSAPEFVVTGARMRRAAGGSPLGIAINNETRITINLHVAKQ